MYNIKNTHLYNNSKDTALKTFMIMVLEKKSMPLANLNNRQDFISNSYTTLRPLLLNAECRFSQAAA